MCNSKYTEENTVQIKRAIVGKQKATIGISKYDIVSTEVKKH